MTLTVNIMSYKYGHLAAQAIESVLNQTRKPDIVRFFDDGAGDCDHLPDIYPEVEFVLRPKNLGIVDNFNDALQRTTTDRVMFLGADNWLRYNAVWECLRHDEDLISYDAWKVITGEEDQYWHLVDRAHGSAMFSVEKAKSAGGYGAVTDSNHTEEDRYLFSNMIEAGASFRIIEKPLLYYRWRHRRNFNQ